MYRHSKHPKLSLIVLTLFTIQILTLPTLNLIPQAQAADPITLSLKWSVTGLNNGESGVIIADVNGDGAEDVIRACAGNMQVFNGLNGDQLWHITDPNLSDMAKPQMADLDGDGDLEIVVNLAHGIMAVHSNNGAGYWYQPNLSGGNHWSSPVIGEVDGSGHPRVFVGSEDVENGLDGAGRLTALTYDGQVLQQIFTWRPCFGGLSLADADLDGHVELFMGDRNSGYGRGIRCFWAENLTVKWERPEILTSSICPVLADINKDGILEVLAGQTGDFCVVDSRDGSFIHRPKTEFPYPDYLENFPIERQPSVYDIDNDGNPEMLMADAHDETGNPRYNDNVIWDLTQWKLDGRVNVGYCYYGPKAADVTGDGLMELIACSYGGVHIFDSNLNLIGQYTGLGPNTFVSRLTYAVVQDIDRDGLVELVVSSFSGPTGTIGASIWAFEISGNPLSPQARGQMRARSEVQHYSERRCGAAEYVEPPRKISNPVILNASPSYKAVNVPATISQLTFSLIDYQNNPIDYTVTTNPNIGSWSGHVPSGTPVSLNIPTLNYLATYTWKIEATDGTHPISPTFTFTTGIASSTPVASNLRFPLRTGNQFLTSDNLLGAYDYFDANGDPQSGTEIRWYKNSILQSMYNNQLQVPSTATSAGETWYFTVRPNDGKGFGTLVTSPTVSIINNAAPTQGNPFLESNPEGLTCSNQSTSTVDKVTNIYSWSRNGASYTSMLMPFDTNNGMTSTDYSGYNNHGALAGPTWTSTGIVGGAYSFDGNDVITIADSASLGNSGSWSQITVEYWVYPSVDQRGARILNKNGGGAGDSGKYMTGFNTASSGPANVIFFGITTGGSYVETYSNTQTAIPTATWSHIVCTYQSGVGIRIYINGVLRSSNDGLTGNIDASTAEPLFIGYASAIPGTTNRYFTGRLDEVRIYPTALSSEQILQNFLNQKDGSSNHSTIVAQETSQGQTWTCSITPNDSWQNGETKQSNPVTIGQAQELNTLTTNIVGSGSVTKTPDQPYYAHNTEVNLTATPANGWNFNGWTGDLSSQNTQVQITMDNNKTVTATFSPSQGFSDGFESGNLDAWTAYAGTPIIQSSITHHGNYAMRSVASGQSCYETISESTVNMRAYFYIETADASAELIRIAAGNNIVALIKRTATGALQLGYLNGGTVNYLISASTVLPADSWHCIELHSTVGSAGDYSAWLDGNEIAAFHITGIDNDNFGVITRAYIGIIYSGGTALSIYSDCAVLSNTYIGPEGSQTGYALSITNVGSGNVNLNPASSFYTPGTEVTMTAIPASGWQFSGWSGDITGNINPATITMNGNKLVTATFTPIGYILTSNTVGSGSVTKNPDQSSYSANTIVTLTAIPQSGWQFSGWSGDLTGLTNPTTITMNTNKVITATFTPIGYTLNINTVGSGSVTKDPNQGSYGSFTVVTLTANPSTGWQFAGWSDDLSGNTNPTTITMNENKVVTATFTQTPTTTYALTMFTTGQGSVIPGNNTYNAGTAVDLKAINAPGWQFTSWSGDALGTSNTTITMNSAKTVYATFIQNEYNLNINVAGSGAVTKNPNQATYHYGDIVVLTANPNTGSSFTGWSGAFSSSTNPITIIINGTTTVTATFAPTTYTLTIIISGPGQVTLTPNKATYNFGETVTLTAIPNNRNFKLDHWDGAISGTSSPATITMNDNKTVYAYFTKK